MISPYLAQGVTGLVDSLKQKRIGRIYQSAYMGDAGSMAQLAERSPELARQLQADMKKRKEVTEQKGLAKQADQVKRREGFKKASRQVMEDLSKFSTYAEAQQYGQQAKSNLAKYFPEVSKNAGFTPEFTEQDFNEAKTIHGEAPEEGDKKTGFQGLIESWKAAEEGSEEKKLLWDKLKKESTSSGGITIGPDGTVQIGGLKPEKPIKREGQQRIISAGESLARLDRIKKNYDPAFLTYKGKLNKGLASIMSKAGQDLSKEDKGMLRQHRKFSQGVNAEFNAYRKLITGAAAAVQELEDLKKAMISTDLSPDEFEAAFNEYSMELSRTLRIRNKVLREGLKPGTKQYGEELNRMYLTGDDDKMDARGDELEASGMSDDDIVKALEQEGYL